MESNAHIAALLAYLLLRERNIRCTIATIGRDAEHITKSVDFDLFVLDTHLLDGNGIMLYDRLHSKIHLEHIPALILSSSIPEHQQEIEGRKLRSLALPFKIDDLLNAVDHFLPRGSRS